MSTFARQASRLLLLPAELGNTIHELVCICTWTERATDHATTVVCAIENFEIGDLGHLKEWMAALTPLPDNATRSYGLRFHIDNNLERSVQKKHRQRHQMSAEAKSVEFEVEVAFDKKTLDLERTLSVMCYRAVPKKLYRAFSQAYHRCESERETLEQMKALYTDSGWEKGSHSWSLSIRTSSTNKIAV